MLLLVGVGASGAPILIRASRARDLIRWKLSLCPQHSASPTTDTMSDAATVTAIRLPPRHQRFKTSLLRLQRLTAVALGVSARHVLSCRHGFLGNLTDSLYSTRAKPREACRRYHRSSRNFTSHDVPLTECSRPLPMWRRSRKQAAHYPPTPKARTQARAG
jgi:hypothetical protein